MVLPACNATKSTSAMSNYPVESPLKSTFALTSKKTYYRVRVEDTPSLRARNSYLTSKASGTEF